MTSAQSDSQQNTIEARCITDCDPVLGVSGWEAGREHVAGGADATIPTIRSPMQIIERPRCAKCGAKMMLAYYQAQETERRSAHLRVHKWGYGETTLVKFW